MGNVSKRVKYGRYFCLEYFSCWFFNRALSIYDCSISIFCKLIEEWLGSLFFPCPVFPVPVQERFMVSITLLLLQHIYHDKGSTHSFGQGDGEGL